MSTYALIGTANGVVRTRDYRMLSEKRWNKQLVLDMKTTFEEYVVPNAREPEVVVIDAGLAIPMEPPMPAETIRHRRMRLGKEDFQLYGYTAG